MRSRWRISIALVLLVATHVAYAVPQGLEFEMREVVRSVDDCDPDAEGCSNIALRYPQILAGPSPWSQQGLPELILGMVTASALGDPNAEAGNPETMFDAFSTEVRTFRAEFPELGVAWAVDREVAILHADERIVSLVLDEYSYLGGAHPNTQRIYRTHDISGGDRLQLYQLFTPAGLAEIEQLAEAAFRRSRGIAPSASLEAEGFWFEDDQFVLTDNWAVDDAGLVFYYNAYEVAAYAAGPTEIRIPWPALAGLVRPDAIIASSS